MKAEVSKLLINIPTEMKSDLSKVCKDLNVSMTQAVLSSIDKFIKVAKNKNK